MGAGCVLTIMLVGIAVWIAVRNSEATKPEFGTESLGLPVAWQMEISSRSRLHSNYVDDEGVFYFADEQPTFYALSQNGELVWKIEYDEPIGRIVKILPIGEKNICFISGQGKTVTVDNKGTISWEFLPHPWEADQHPPTPDGPLADLVVPQGKKLFGVTQGGKLAWVLGDCYEYFSSYYPIFKDSYGIVFLSESDEIVKLDLSGNEKWRYSSGWCRNPILAKNGTLIMQNNNGITSLDSDGNVLWQFPSSYPQNMDFEKSGVLLVNTLKHDLMALDLSGNPLWQVPGRGRSFMLGKVDNNHFLVNESVETASSLFASQLGLTGDLSMSFIHNLAIYNIHGEQLWKSELNTWGLRVFNTLPSGLLLCEKDNTIFALDIPAVIEELQP